MHDILNDCPSYLFFGLFYISCFWKNFRVRKALTCNNADTNMIYIFAYDYISLKINSANLKSIKLN